MLIALVILNLIHPGRHMPGAENNLPSHKERRREGIRSKSEKVSGSFVLTV
jgi:hypothetical protein